MKKSGIALDITVITDDQATEVAQPGKSAFHFPASFVSSERSSILGGGLNAVGPVRANQLNAAAFETLTQRIGIRRAIINQTRHAFPGAAWPPAWNRHFIEGGLDQRRFTRRRRI